MGIRVIQWRSSTNACLLFGTHQMRFYFRETSGAFAGAGRACAAVMILLTAPAQAAEPVEKPLSRQEVLDGLRLDCVTGDGYACYTLGRDYETRNDLWGQPVRGDGLKRDDRKAAYFFRKSCDAGVKEGCSNLARLYEAGKGVARNKAEAARLYQIACAPGDGAPCKTIKAPAGSSSDIH